MITKQKHNFKNNKVVRSSANTLLNVTIFNHIKNCSGGIILFDVRNEIYSSSDCQYIISCTLLLPSLMTASKQNACLCACLASFLPASLPLRLLFCLQPCICRYLFFMPATMPTCLFAYHPALMPASKPTVLPASLLGTSKEAICNLFLSFHQCIAHLLSQHIPESPLAISC